jgi:hypothetical protein
MQVVAGVRDRERDRLTTRVDAERLALLGQSGGRRHATRTGTQQPGQRLRLGQVRERGQL